MAQDLRALNMQNKMAEWAARISERTEPDVPAEQRGSVKARLEGLKAMSEQAHAKERGRDMAQDKTHKRGKDTRRM